MSIPPTSQLPLPMSAADVARRGWESVDVVLVSGDAYIDHPSFAAALIGRTLEAAGWRVAILAQPDWHSAEAFSVFGRPRLCFGVSAGNMDSMLNHYTANRRPRSEDAYSPAGRAGLRPDRATNVYAQRCREAFPGVAVIAGGGRGVPEETRALRLLVRHRQTLGSGEQQGRPDCFRHG